MLTNGKSLAIVIGSTEFTTAVAATTVNNNWDWDRTKENLKEANNLDNCMFVDENSCSTQTISAKIWANPTNYYNSLSPNQGKKEFLKSLTEYYSPGITSVKDLFSLGKEGPCGI